MHDITVRQCVFYIGEYEEAPSSPGSNLPKAFSICGDRPFLAWSMREMQRFGVEEFVLLVSSISAELEFAIGQIRFFLPKFSKITLSAHNSSSGIGGALQASRSLLKERFFFCRGEMLFSCNISRFLQKARTGNHVLLWSEGNLIPIYDRCMTEHDNDTGSVHSECVRSQGKEFHISGIYVFDQSIFDFISSDFFLKDEILKEFVHTRTLGVVSLQGAFWDISKFDCSEIKALNLSRTLLRPAVFLDRDGVINRDHGWVGTRDRFEWENNVRETLARIADDGYHIFIVTNQSGIARGFYSEQDLECLMDWAIDSIRKFGGNIDDWRYCPMHPDAVIEKYRGVSTDRKPEPGMIFDLLKRWELCPSACLLFGDQPSDLEAADAAGVQGIMVGPASLAELIAEKEKCEPRRGGKK